MASRYRDRPPASYETGPTTRALRVVSVAAAGFALIVALAAYPQLPQTVVTHLDAAGVPDSWGPRWTVLILLGIWAVLQALLAWVSRRPRVFNYPVEVTEANAQRLYREGERMMVWLGCSVALLFAGIVGVIYGLPSIALAVVGLIAVVGTAFAGLVRTSMASG